MKCELWADQVVVTIKGEMYKYHQIIDDKEKRDRLIKQVNAKQKINEDYWIYVEDNPDGYELLEDQIYRNGERKIDQIVRVCKFIYKSHPDTVLKLIKLLAGDTLTFNGVSITNHCFDEHYDLRNSYELDLCHYPAWKVSTPLLNI